MPLVAPTRAFARVPLSITEIEAKRFGTSYCGLSLSVAFAETVLHDALPELGRFRVEGDSIASRYVVEFVGKKLRLADLTGVALKRTGIHGSLTTVDEYEVPRKWAVAIHRHPQQVDGILYMSKHVNSEQAAVIFDRAKHKLRARRYTPLFDFPGALRTVHALGVDVL